MQKSQFNDVFISYSRKDKEFVQQIYSALATSNRDIWIDWQDIPFTADWWEEIKAGIEAANSFVFVLSPDAVASTVCAQEVEHAVKNNKRLVPLVRREHFEVEQIHPALRKHNWLFFRDEDDFNVAFELLLQAIDTDLEYIKAHTRLLVYAIDWKNNGYNDSYLLRGDELAVAERWLEESVSKALQPTTQHWHYISKGREVEDASRKLMQKVLELEEINQQLLQKNRQLEAEDQILKRTIRLITLFLLG